MSYRTVVSPTPPQLPLSYQLNARLPLLSVLLHITLQVLHLKSRASIKHIASSQLVKKLHNHNHLLISAHHRTISRASRLAWTTRPGRSYRRRSRNIRSITMIGRIMLCSSVMAQQVRLRVLLCSQISCFSIFSERCLSYDEKPLLLFQKLKDAKKNPVFMLKHIRDIRSPIVVAQQKHAARKASESTSTSGRNNQQSHSRSVSRPTAKINLNTPPLATATTAQSSSWPELMSPAAEQKDKLDESIRANASGSGTVGSATENEHGEASHNAARQEVIATGVSYAVAIYPYMAEQDDEFDVVV